MREIKFRAWFEGHMYEVAKLDFWGDPEQATCDLAGPGENGEGEEFFDIYVGEVELMQYTGLKDKNGKEIYEGDIVENSTQTVYLGHKYEVVWNKNYAGYQLMSNGFASNIPLIQNFMSYKVIGNIYENPELLEEEE